MLDSIHNNCGEWISGRGPESDIVISTRVRLARNVAEFPFLTRITENQRRDLENYLKERIMSSDLGIQLFYAPLSQASTLDRACLVERHLISQEHATGDGNRGVVIGEGESLAIMINEEDHLRLQVLRSGLQCESARGEMNRVDDSLGDHLNYAFNEKFGYLTACPTNAGTGLRVSVMVHLPALVMTKQIEKVFHAVSKINLAVRGFYGEGTQASGDLYQISNQVTLGKGEDEIIENIMAVVPQIVKYERTVRDALMKENRVSLEDRVRRAYGMMKEVRTITSEETMELLSAVRMGTNLDLIPEIPITTVNELFIQTQPAHLQKHAGNLLDTPERDVIRATYVRQRLSSNN